MDNETMDKDLNVNGTASNEAPAGVDVERVEPSLHPGEHVALQDLAAERVGAADLEPSATQPGWFARMVAHPRAPLVVGGVVLAIAALFGARQYLPTQSATPNIVVFDPVKFANAQRAAASILAVSPSADLTLTMTEVAKNADPVIREEAHGALILVKQAVVNPEGLPDITDAVLKHFGLQTNVPTVSTSPSKLSLESVAPTDSSYSPGKQAEDYRMELQTRDVQAAQAAAKQDAQSKVLP